MSCPAKDAKGNSCRNKGPFCRSHTYMKDYTPEMIAGCKLCKGCKKMKFTEMETCEECRAHGAEKRKQAKAAIVLCAKEGCKYKKSENKYCGKHQLCQFIDETAALRLKPCHNANRGCRSQMAMDGKYSCDVCLGKEREKDHKKRSVEPAKTEIENECTRCRKMKPLEAFKGNVGETKTCMVCREANKRADEKRDAEHVKEVARKNASKPERNEVKQAWKEANYEKVAMYWIEARARMIEEDQEGYLKQNAEQSKKWREANPEKVHEPCYLCGKENNDTHQNGIDRVDSSIGYIESNIQSCCGSCNYMKSNYSLEIFLEKCTLIALNHKQVETNIQNIPIVKSNKLTVEAKRERERVRKQEQREAQRKEYGEEEYKKMHAKKIADQRKKRNS